MFSWNYERPCLLGLPSGRGSSHCHWCLSHWFPCCCAVSFLPLPPAPLGRPGEPSTSSPHCSITPPLRRTSEALPKRWKKGAPPAHCPRLRCPSPPAFTEASCPLLLASSCWGWKVFSDVWGKAQPAEGRGTVRMGAAGLGLRALFCQMPLGPRGCKGSLAQAQPAPSWCKFPACLCPGLGSCHLTPPTWSNSPAPSPACWRFLDPSLGGGGL